MTKVWGATSTTDDVLSGVDFRGKCILVTGVSAGIGVETARAIAAHGAQMTGAVRDLEKAEAATAQVRKDAAANAGSFDLVALDLASLKSVRACADKLLKSAALDAAAASLRDADAGRAGMAASARPQHSSHFRHVVDPPCAKLSRRETGDSTGNHRRARQHRGRDSDRLRSHLPFPSNR